MSFKLVSILMAVAVTILHAQPAGAETFVVNSEREGGDTNLGDGICYTGDTNSVGEMECVFRGAIYEANALPGPDTILFNIPVSGQAQVNLHPGMLQHPPNVVEEIVIDGMSQPSGGPVVVRDVATNLHIREGLRVSANNCEIRGLYFWGFDGGGILLNEADSCVIQGCIFAFSLYYGVGLRHSSHNLIGGEDSANGNEFDFNLQFGILVESSDSNKIQGNRIHTQQHGDGVRIWSGSGNEVSYNALYLNDSSGVKVSSGVGNTIRSNAIYGNTAYGIELIPTGPNPNDPLDLDTGANSLTNYPVIDSFTTSVVGTTVHGTMDGMASHTYVIECFVNSECDSSGYGEGERPVCTTTVSTNAVGHVEFWATFPVGLQAGEVITATATDEDGSTSEFSPCSDPRPADVGNDVPLVPSSFALYQNYPNPFNASTRISYSLPAPSEVTLAIYDVLGCHVMTLSSGAQPAGEHSVIWDGKHKAGHTVASGVYLVRLSVGDVAVTRKVMLLK
jgi:hypothetical protein